MKKIVVLGIIFLVFSSFTVYYNDDFTDLVQIKLKSYSTEKWPEKVYVHTDKPYYALGEDLWFSTYLVNGITHKASSKSNVVYVELINDTDSIVDTKRLFVNQMSTGSQFKIKKEWSPGNYLLRAYTNYMRNEDSEIFFQKEIQVISLNQEKTESAFKNDETKTQNTSLDPKKPDLEFFPEGGYLVNDINSKVAIKIKDSRYHNYKLPIEIIDSKGLVLSSFKSSEFGLGLFYINPKPNEDYYANLKLNDKVYQYRLPRALTNGFGLNVNYRNDALMIGLSSTKEKGLENSYVTVHQRGKLVFDQIITTTERTNTVSLFTGKLKDGVIHITLFNAESQPVCERLVFINNPSNDVSVIIKNNKEKLKSREKATLKLHIQGNDGSNLEGYLSLSVRDANAIPHDKNASTIKTWLLLNSDLRGTIENPSYFFTKGESLKKKYLLDLVMMTNGWRRFTWQNILYDKLNDDEFKVEKGITITGTTKALKPPHKTVSAINTITFLGKQSIETESANSNKYGQFRFGPYVFFDSIQTLLESKLIDPASRTVDSYRNVLISMDEKTHKSPEVKRSQTSYYLPNDVLIKDDFLEAARYQRDLNLEYSGQSELLDEVVLTTTLRTKEQEREKEMENRSYYGAPSRRLDIESDTFLPNTPLRLIFQRFSGVRVGSRFLYYRGEICRLLFNNMEVDLDFITSLNPADISFIDFYAPTNSVYSRAPGGVFTVYGKLGVDANLKKTPRLPGIINFTIKGFDKSKEFYAPDYSKNMHQMTKPDVRTTLHWEPQIKITKENQTAEISFYTCDSKGNYIIEVEGISNSGIPLHQTSTFLVE
jgi:hypothetical protein